MIIPQDFKSITIKLTQGAKLFATLKEMHISPLAFFAYLNKNPEAKLEFEQARQIAVEQVLDESISGIDNCRDELALKKQTLKVKTNQWLAEKIIPETYGTRIDVNVHKTIDIRAVLADARARVESDADKAIEVQGRVVEGYEDILGDG